jgi:hypothetical protein
MTPAEAPRPAHSSKLDIVIAVLLAVVAVSSAFAAWRTSVVGSNVAGTNRSGMLEVSQLQTMHQIDEAAAYAEASAAARAAMQAASTGILIDSGNAALSAAGQGLRDNLIPALQQQGGPFGAGDFTTAAGTFDVDARTAAMDAADANYSALQPATTFALADDYADEKRWLTVISVVLAISLFWLGLAEITAGRWRIANLVAGVGLWLAGIGTLLLVEAAFVVGRGGVL